MAQVQVRHRDWFMLAERGVIRLAMILLGMMFIVAGLGMCMSIVLLLPGMVIGLSGVALLVWGALEEIPVGNS